MTTTPEPTSDDARRLRYSVTRLARQLRRQAGTDLTPTQSAALVSIERHGPITIGDLAAHEQVSAPTATNVVSKLEAAGLVQPAPRRRRPPRLPRRAHRRRAGASSRRAGTARRRGSRPACATSPPTTSRSSPPRSTCSST